jgi:hypothetical protein
MFITGQFQLKKYIQRQQLTERDFTLITGLLISGKSSHYRLSAISPLVGMSSLNYVFFGSISRAEFMYVHCKKTLESLAQISAFRNKQQNVSITYTTHFRAFQG